MDSDITIWQWVWMKVTGFWGGVGTTLIGIQAMGYIKYYLQRKFGAPSLSIEFVEDGSPQDRWLYCHIYNEPIDNWFLRKIGVKRDEVKIFGHAEIRDAESGHLHHNTQILFWEDGRWVSKVLIDSHLAIRFDLGRRKDSITTLTAGGSGGEQLERNRYRLRGEFFCVDIPYLFDICFINATDFSWEKWTFVSATFNRYAQ